MRGTRCIAQSGERTLRAGTISVGDSTRNIILPVDDDGITRYSLNELRRGAILCRECRRIILFDELVDLERYDRPSANDFVHYDEKSRVSVVCEHCGTSLVLRHIWIRDPATGTGRVADAHVLKNPAMPATV